MTPSSRFRTGSFGLRHSKKKENASSTMSDLQPAACSQPRRSSFGRRGIPWTKRLRHALVPGATITPRSPRRGPVFGIVADPSKSARSTFNRTRTRQASVRWRILRRMVVTVSARSARWSESSLASSPGPLERERAETGSNEGFSLNKRVVFGGSTTPNLRFKEAGA
jgi:hypothetical protein